MAHRRSVRCGPGVGEGAVDKAQRIVDLTKNPQRKGVENLRCGTGIRAEPIREIGMARLVVELDGLLKMVMGADKVAEMKAGDAGNAVRDQASIATTHAGWPAKNVSTCSRRSRLRNTTLPHASAPCA